MTQPNLLELAKQGDATAIAALMNRHLLPKGITAKVSVINDCLMVIAESTHPPAPLFMVNFVRKGMIALNAEAIKRVVVWGQASGMTVPAWRETFELSNGVPAQQVKPSKFQNGRDSTTEGFSTSQPQTKSSSLSNPLNLIQNSKLEIALLVLALFILATVFYAVREILVVKPDSSEATSDGSSNSSVPAQIGSEPENFLQVYFKETLNKETKDREYWCSESKELARPLYATGGWQLLNVKKYDSGSADTLVKIKSTDREKVQTSKNWNIYIKKEADPELANKLPGGWCIASIYEKSN